MVGLDSDNRRLYSLFMVLGVLKMRAILLDQPDFEDPLLEDARRALREGLDISRDYDRTPPIHAKNGLNAVLSMLEQMIAEYEDR